MPCILHPLRRKYCRPDQNFEHETKTDAVEIDGPPLRSYDSPIVLHEEEYSKRIFRASEGRTVLSTVGQAIILNCSRSIS
jgi:hypothetical protein